MALAKISLVAVSVAGVGTVSAFAIKNSIDNDPTPHKISGSDQQDAGTINPPTQTSQTTVPPTKLSVVVVKSQAVQPPRTASQLTVSGASQSYKCRLKDGNPKDTPSICKLVELSIFNKWIDLAAIKQATQTTTLSLDNLKDPTKQFKLEVSEELFNKVTPTTTKIVEIVSDAGSSVVHAELSTLFKVDANTVDYENVSTLLARAAVEYAPIDTSKQNQCFFTDSTDLSAYHNCTFRSFGSSTASPSGAGYSNQTITSFEAPAPTTFTIGNYYLLDYATPLAKTDLSKIDVAENAREGAYQATLDNVVPVIFNGSGENKKAFILSETQAFKGVVVNNDSISSPQSLTFNTQPKTYKCKYDSHEAVDCELRLIPFTTTKTSYNTSEIKAINRSEAVSITATTSPNSYYKVEVESSFVTHFTKGTTPKPIQILDATDESKRLFTLDILYTIDDDVEYEGESSYIVKTATLPSNPSPSPAPFVPGQKKYCAFVANDSSDVSNVQECEIKDLGTTIPTDQNFTTPTDATTITTTNTYLVTFVKSASVTTPIVKDIKEKLLVFLQATDGNTPSKTKVATFAKANIEYALIVDGDKNNKFAFVLDKTPTSP